jgi:hypothetical protein
VCARRPDHEHGHAPPAQPVRHERLVDGVRKRLRRLLLRLERRGLLRGGLDLRGENVDLVLEQLPLGVLDDPLARDPDPDHDAHDERQEDGRQRGDVVAEVEHRVRE